MATGRCMYFFIPFPDSSCKCTPPLFLFYFSFLNYNSLGNPSHLYCFPHLWKDVISKAYQDSGQCTQASRQCMFLPVHRATLQRQLSASHSASFFQEQFSITEQGFPRRFYRGTNSFALSVGGGFCHVNIHTTTTPLILSCPLPILTQKSFHKSQEQNGGFLVVGFF